MRGASENVSKPQPTEPDERGDLYRFGSRSLVVDERGRRVCGRGRRVAGVETVVRERHEEGTESRSETERREKRARAVDGYTERDETARKDVVREKERRNARNRRKRGRRTDGRKSRGLSVPLLRKVTND